MNIRTLAALTLLCALAAAPAFAGWIVDAKGNAVNLDRTDRLVIVFVRSTVVGDMWMVRTSGDDAVTLRIFLDELEARDWIAHFVATGETP